MYFNCPSHPPKYRRLKNLYVRRLGFRFQKEDFVYSKAGNAYSEREFDLFIDGIHSKTRLFVLVYKILTGIYIAFWVVFVVLLFAKGESLKLYCFLPFVCAGVIAFGLIKAKDHYIQTLNEILTHENENIIKNNGVRWVLGPSASFIQLFHIEEDKIPLNL